MEKTQWFSVDTLPVRAGWYEAQYCNGVIAKRWFDLKVWRHAPGDYISLFGDKYAEGEKWRGLTKEAE